MVICRLTPILVEIGLICRLLPQRQIGPVTAARIRCVLAVLCFALFNVLYISIVMILQDVCLLLAELSSAIDVPNNKGTATQLQLTKRQRKNPALRDQDFLWMT